MPGVFFAYLKDVYSDGGRQYLITFSSREIADEWWRVMSSFSSPYARYITRTSPQFYAMSPGRDVTNFFTDPTLPDAGRFIKKMFFTQINNITDGYGRRDSPATAPSVDITDHISGRWYFIRSKADPHSHWYLRTSGTCVVCGDTSCDVIHVSNEYRTRFCVQVRGPAKVPDDFVMIGKDEVSIVTSKGHTVHINDTGDLEATKEYQCEPDLIFGDLENRFIARAERRVNGEVWQYVESVERGVGEVWELVK